MPCCIVVRLLSGWKLAAVTHIFATNNAVSSFCHCVIVVLFVAGELQRLLTVT